MYEAARLLFKNIHNNAKLALCLVHLGQYREAVEAATKANAVNTWKQVRCSAYAVVVSHVGSLVQNTLGGPSPSSQKIKQTKNGLLS